MSTTEEAGTAAKGTLFAGRLVSPIAAFVVIAQASPAFAFGGFWSSSREPVSQTASSVLFIDNPDETITAIIQPSFEGPAREFAWVIPVRGTPSIGVSSKLVFQRLDAETAPQYWVERARAGACAIREDSPNETRHTTNAGASSEDTAAVTAIEHGSIAPYDYVTLEIDANAAEPARQARDWLSSNGYAPADLDLQIFQSYLDEGSNFVAFKLASAADASSVRPIVLTYESDRPRIPIRATAVSARDDMPLRVWVLGPAQAVPDNYASLVVNDALFDWLRGLMRYDSGTLPANGAGPFGPPSNAPINYDGVIGAAANEAGGRGFVTELAAPASRFRELLWSSVDRDTFASVSSTTYDDGFDALLAAHALYAGWDGFEVAVQGASTLPADVSLEALARDPLPYRGRVKVDAAKLFALLEEHVIAPIAETAERFFQAPYLTRLYTTLSAGEMTLDPTFDYNADLAQVSNIHIAKQILDCDPSRPDSDLAWRTELPQGGVVAGGPGDVWPVALDSMPANLKIVMLSNRGSGRVVADNSAAIRRALKSAGGTITGEMPMLHPQPNGVAIGGTQTVQTFEPPGEAPNQAKRGSGSCSAAPSGESGGSVFAVWLPLLAAGLLLRRLRRRRFLAVLVMCALTACSDDDMPAPAPSSNDAGVALPPGALTREQLRDPQTCKTCHPTHYNEWSSSMHAYSAKDPVFLAMNRRGQRETNGELGGFCIKCHAPMALFDERTRDGLNLEQLPDIDQGISCYFCHNIAGIEDDHNGLMHLANDRTMRGPIQDPLPPVAHEAAYSDLFDATGPLGSAMCGSCHDIVMPSGVHLERTFMEYGAGLFSKSADGKPPSNGTCMGCHMPSRQGFAAATPDGVKQPRMVHEHMWPGIDVALVDFPHREAMRSAVEDCQLGQPSVSFFTLEVTPPDLFTIQVETNAGHNQPSGSAQDRRMWVEFLAYDQDGSLLSEASSGNIGDHEIEEWPEGNPKHDRELLMFRDRIFDSKGDPVHMFWEAEKSKDYPDGYQTQLLPVATTTYIEGRHSIVKQYRASTPDGRLPSRVTAQLKIRPIGHDVLDDLVASGDLDRAIAQEMPTFTFGARIEWTPELGLQKPISANVQTDCSTYRCLLDPESERCK